MLLGIQVLLISNALSCLDPSDYAVFNKSFFKTATKTRDALEALLDCEFVHSIDAPSLALLMPILSRALRERAADIKRRASAISGNIMSMISDSKSLIPYIAGLLIGLKECLVDPIPDVRATSAKALGALISGIGFEEIEKPDSDIGGMIPWLLSTLRSEASPVERSGAAQGLAEVCVVVNAEKVEDILADTLTWLQDKSYASREVTALFLSI
jgi:hypothetical protein